MEGTPYCKPHFIEIFKTKGRQCHSAIYALIVLCSRFQIMDILGFFVKKILLKYLRISVLHTLLVYICFVIVCICVCILYLNCIHYIQYRYMHTFCADIFARNCLYTFKVSIHIFVFMSVFKYQYVCGVLCVLLHLD